MYMSKKRKYKMQSFFKWLGGDKSTDYIENQRNQESFSFFLTKAGNNVVLASVLK